MTETAPRRLPVYLLGKAPLSVGVDGPALVSESTGQAPARYPVGRIARVLVLVRHQWQPEATALCLRHRVPVLFVDDDGRHVGSVQPVRPRPVSAHEGIGRLLFAPGGEERLENWLRAEYLEQVNRADVPAFRERQELVRRYVHGQVPAPSAHGESEQRVETALCGLVEQALVGRHLATHYPLAGGQWWHLAGELRELLFTAWRLASGGLARQHHANAQGTLELFHRRHQHEMSRRVYRALDRLERIAREADIEWP